jgi:hypothetical protein
MDRRGSSPSEAFGRWKGQRRFHRKITKAIDHLGSGQGSMAESVFDPVAEGEGEMIALGYIWKVVVNIVILFIVAWALDKLNGRTETLIVAVLGMIYVTRTTQGFQGLAMVELALLHQEQIDAIRTWIDGTYQPDRADELKFFKRVRAKFYIDCIFLALISLLCMLVFFSRL